LNGGQAYRIRQLDEDSFGTTFSPRIGKAAGVPPILTKDGGNGMKSGPTRG
jgi:hypothetical protein